MCQWGAVSTRWLHRNGSGQWLVMRVRPATNWHVYFSLACPCTLCANVVEMAWVGVLHTSTTVSGIAHFGKWCTYRYACVVRRSYLPWDRVLLYQKIAEGPIVLFWALWSNSLLLGSMKSGWPTLTGTKWHVDQHQPSTKTNWMCSQPCSGKNGVLGSIAITPVLHCIWHH